MLNFKELVAQDIAVFMNPDEFGDMHNIEGKNITVVIDADTLKEKSMNGASAYATHSGVMLSEFTMYVKCEDLDEKPWIGQRMTLDGELYLVTDVAETAGIYQITLGANIA
ncbi:hypothetical protein [Brevibacillus sp. DP1.3A]|uniref:hypothetical protein n=1 Tax=Brevibacillus sp. DP1.3A TaxID=2738867 RepID=UPI00156ABE93|nr:hypothetical protein [Brevibacillus sp. DP1.3A]UED76093.1 hypothetical protein HP399_006260 [Brevibacillus sp. DP1.3A]